jgi:hypothetical protein
VHLYGINCIETTSQLKGKGERVEPIGRDGDTRRAIKHTTLTVGFFKRAIYNSRGGIVLDQGPPTSSRAETTLGGERERGAQKPAVVPTFFLFFESSGLTGPLSPF